MVPLLAIHKIAADRGEGLRPELLRAVTRFTADTEDYPTSNSSRTDSAPAQPALNLATTSAGPSHDDVLTFQRSRKRLVAEDALSTHGL